MANRNIHLRVVITGGAGFIGSTLVDNLLRTGAKVVAVDSFDPFYDPDVKSQNLVAARRNHNFRLIESDVRDVEKLDAALGDAPYDAIIHLAAAVGVRPSIRNPARYVTMNVEGTTSALALAERKRIGLFLFGSSSSVYGDSAPVPFVESDPAVSPISPYAATKRAGELLCHSAHHLLGISVICLRFFTVYGPRQRPDLAIHRFVSMIEKEEPLTIYGDGQARRDYTHVTDIVAGITSALEYAVTGKMFEIVNLGGGQPITVMNLIALLEQLLGKKAALRWFPAQDGDVRQTFASTEKALRLLNFKPSVGLEEGLSGFVDWYRRSRR